jgi:hypothetical protein
MYECSSSGLLGLLLFGRSKHSAPAAPRGPSGASAKLGDCTSIPYIGNSAKSPHGRGRPGQPGPPPASATVRPIPAKVPPARLLAADRPLSRQVLGARCLRPPSSAGSTCSVSFSTTVRIARRSLPSALELDLSLGSSSLGNTRPVASRCRLDSPA